MHPNEQTTAGKVVKQEEVKPKPPPAKPRPKFKSKPKLSKGVVSFRERKKKQYRKEGKTSEWIHAWETKYNSPGGAKL